jgi:3-isopropylmalate/(R)-2-methylmalate dehydratase small subunit
MVDHVDTDQIIPSREMKKVGRDGLAEGLFANWRYEDPGARVPNRDFVLNSEDAKGARILLSGRNFGCGSSREHAVWALADFGFRAIIADSFGSIFRGNCVRNGILPIPLPDGQHREWTVYQPVAIDLEAQTVTPEGRGGEAVRFDIDPYSKTLLLEGLDPIELTLRDSTLIDGFLERDRKARPWLYSAA